MESIFAFLFKYRPSVWESGTVGWAPPVAPTILFAALAAAIIATAVLYARVRGRTTPLDRVLLIALRASAIGVLGFCLFRPQLVLSTVVPMQNYVGIVVDESSSMRVADEAAGGARGAAAAALFGSTEGTITDALAERFKLRHYGFAANARRIDGAETLAFDGGRTQVAPALDRVREDLAAVPVSGIVLVSDGADGGAVNADALTESLLSLRAAGVPVYAVGLGRESFARDIELSRVATPVEVLRGASLVVDLIVAQNGYAGETVQLVVEDDGRIVSTQDVVLPRDGEPAPVRVHFTAADPGPRNFRFRITPRDGEQVAENNVQEATIVVRDDREKVLYFEGEPRFEVKFMRRAVEDDKNLQLVVLQRMAANKFLRLSVDSAGELATGFPRTRDELFSYRALILGSVEASFFTHDQLQMIADFVSERGGGLLVLGGRRSLAEGGWAGTPVADVLPVELGTARDTSFFAEVSVAPTRAGVTHAATQIADGETNSAERWRSLPPVTVVNRVSRVKPGATVLLTGAGQVDDQVILAAQRYGRGQAIAFTPHDSWIWQMHADVPIEDQTHETFWRQMMRWLVNGVPDQVVVRAERDQVAPGEAVRLVAEVDDERYLKVNNGTVLAHVIAPSGAERTVPLSWTVERDGEYAGQFIAEEQGLYEVRVAASFRGTTVESEPAYVRASPSTSEFFGAQMRSTLLKRIAEETGGRFYTADNVSQLSEDLAVSGRGASVTETRDLWDMPANLLALLGLIAAEWWYRRRRGLV